MKVKNIFFTTPNKVLIVLVGTYNSLKAPPADPCDKLYAVWYNLHIYRKFDNFLLEILVNDDNFNGHDGVVGCNTLTFPYKTKDDIEKKLNLLNISNNILNSLEIFVKPNYAKKYDSLFTLKDSYFNTNTLKAILNEVPLSTKNLTKYNNIAYYLEQAGAYKEAIYLLKKIIEKYPNRTVAYINLGDAYLKDNQKEKAIKNYNIYVKQMKEKKKEKRIPKRILELLN